MPGRYGEVATLIQLVNWAFSIFNIALWARVIMSFIRPPRYSRWYYTLSSIVYRITEPVLAPIRGWLPTASYGIDFSPIVAVLLLSVLQRIIRQLLVALVF